MSSSTRKINLEKLCSAQRSSGEHSAANRSPRIPNSILMNCCYNTEELWSARPSVDARSGTT